MGFHESPSDVPPRGKRFSGPSPHRRRSFSLPLSRGRRGLFPPVVFRVFFGVAIRLKRLLCSFVSYGPRFLPLCLPPPPPFSNLYREASGPIHLFSFPANHHATPLPRQFKTRSSFPALFLLFPPFLVSLVYLSRPSLIPSYSRDALSVLLFSN